MNWFDRFKNAGNAAVKVAAKTAVNAISPSAGAALDIFEVAKNVRQALVKPPTQPMVFPVGAGMDQNQEPGPRVAKLAPQKVIQDAAKKEADFQKYRKENVLDERAKDFGKSVLRAPPKLVAQLALDAAGIKQSPTPQGAVQQAVLGDEPINPMSKDIRGFNKTAETVADYIRPDLKGKKDLASTVGKLPFMIPAGLVFGGVRALDADVGIGGAGEKIAKETGEQVAKQTAEQFGKDATERFAREGAEKLAQDGTEKIAQKTAEDVVPKIVKPPKITKKAEDILREQIGDSFKIVEPEGDLWKGKGNIVFIEPKRDSVGFASWLRGKNFIEQADEAGNGIYRVKVKNEPTKRFNNALEALQDPEMQARYAKLRAQQKASLKTSNQLYHTTSAENLQSIAQEGLVTGKKPRFEGVSSPDRISMSANEEAANYYGKQGDVMLRTKPSYKPKDLESDLLAGGEGTYTTKTNIPPDQLEVKMGDKWVPLKKAPITSNAPTKPVITSSIADNPEPYRQRVKSAVDAHISANPENFADIDAEKFSDEMLNHYATAERIKPEVDAAADSVAAQIPGAKVAKAPIKGFKNNGEFDPSRAVEKALQAKNVKDVKDLARNTVVVPTLDDVKNIPDLLSMQPNVVYKPSKNFFDTPTPFGYRGINASYVDPTTGFIGEMQANIPEMIFVKENEAGAKALLGEEEWNKLKDAGLKPGIGHELYEKHRSLLENLEQQGKNPFIENGGFVSASDLGINPKQLAELQKDILLSRQSYSDALAVAERRGSLKPDSARRLENSSSETIRPSDMMSVNGGNAEPGFPEMRKSVPDSSANTGVAPSESGVKMMSVGSDINNEVNGVTPPYASILPQNERSVKSSIINTAPESQFSLVRPPSIIDDKGIANGLKTAPETKPRLAAGMSKTEPTVDEMASNFESLSDSPEKASLFQRFKQSVNDQWTKTREFLPDSIRQKNLERAPGVKAEGLTPYQAETLYHGRVGTRIEDVRDETKAIIDDFVGTAKANKQETNKLRDEVNEYLLARHAPERNARLGDGAAGITDAQATQMMANLEAKPHAQEIKRLADKVQELNNKTLDTLLEGDVIDKETYDTLRSAYQNHVPLNRVMDDTGDIVQALSGPGFKTGGTGIKRARGSSRKVEDIFGNVVANLEGAVVRAEKNRVNKTIVDFAKANMDTGLFEIVRPKVIGQTFDGKPLLERITDPSVLEARVAGRPVYVRVTDPKLAAAYQGLNKEQADVITNTVGKVTRLYSGLATRFNPEFAFSNKVRDLQEMLVSMSAEQGFGAKGAAVALKNDAWSMRAVTEELLGKETEGAKLYKQMKADGGVTGGMAMSTRDAVKLDVSKMQKLAESSPRKAAEHLVGVIDKWNTIFEDSTRLSVYKSALDRGMSRDAAAVLAKNSTINFNKKGTGGSLINALYMFSNASIQGSAKLMRAMKNPKVAAATVASVGSAVAIVNSWNDRVDPEWRGKVSKWDKTSNLTVVLPSTGDGGIRYITIPVSWGLKPIKVAADDIYDWTTGHLSSGQSAIEKLLNIGENAISTMVDAYNPLGGTDAASTIMPTALDTPFDIWRNQSWSGKKIKPDSNQKLSNYNKYWGSTPDTFEGSLAIKGAKLLYDKTNGSINWSPESIIYAYEQMIGGAGKSATRVVNTVSSLMLRKPPDIGQVPFLNRFYKSVPEDRAQSNASGAFNDRISKATQEQANMVFERGQKAKQLDVELSKLSKEEANARVKQLKKDDPLLYKRLIKTIKDRKLGRDWQEKAMLNLSVADGKRAQFIHETIKEDYDTPEERNAYFKELKDKKIITPAVAKQIAELVASEKNAAK